LQLVEQSEREVAHQGEETDGMIVRQRAASRSEASRSEFLVPPGSVSLRLAETTRHSLADSPGALRAQLLHQAVSLLLTAQVFHQPVARRL